MSVRPVDPQATVYVDADLRDLIPGFVSNRHRDVERLLTASGANDFDTARIIGHSMKGSGGGYGFPRITELGDKVEQAAIRRDAVEIAKLANELGQYLKAVKIEYRPA